jgi:peptidoglycan/xylan/chitin deacetylase (PgdA/CDA1 family)
MAIHLYKVKSNTTLNRLLFILLRYSGVALFFRQFIQIKKVTILCFHDISYDCAEKTFTYLLKHYNIIDLNTFIHAAESNNRNVLPKKALIINFDDGFIRNYELMPLIQKYKIPIIIFICAGLVNTNRQLWFNFKAQKLLGVSFKNIRNVERIKILEQAGFNQTNESETPEVLSKNHIDEMRSYVNFQSHTVFHPFLTMCEEQEAKTEITKSKEILEKEYNLTINTIAYPHGDYSQREIALIREAGYKCGVTVDYGFNTIHSDLLRLKRLPVNDTEDLNELVVKASGAWGFLKTTFLKLRMKRLRY